MKTSKVLFVLGLVGAFLLAITIASSRALAETAKAKSAGKPSSKHVEESQADESDEEGTDEDQSGDDQQVAKPKVKHKDLDKGDFTLSFVKPAGESEKAVYNILKNDDTFKNLIDEVNHTIGLPRNIPVHFRSCGEANAFYDPEKRDISMCYELFLEYINLLDDEELSDEELGTKVIEAATFIMFHEMGHSLVDNLDIPVTGKEEDAVDDFAAVLAVSLDEEGENIIAASIESFGAWADQEDSDSLAFEDEHSLNAQRFYSIACVLYGSNPEKFSAMVEDELLPEARAERCPGEFQQKVNSWGRLLGDYLKG